MSPSSSQDVNHDDEDVDEEDDRTVFVPTQIPSPTDSPKLSREVESSAAVSSSSTGGAGGGPLPPSQEEFLRDVLSDRVTTPSDLETHAEEALVRENASIVKVRWGLEKVAAVIHFLLLLRLLEACLGRWDVCAVSLSLWQLSAQGGETSFGKSYA